MKDGIEYFPLDVAVHRSAKLADLSLEEFGLWAMGLSYCNDEKTDGFIPAAKVKGFGSCGRSTKLAPELVKKGRWREVPGGYESVGFLDHNKSKAEIAAAKAKRRAAGQAGGQQAQRKKQPPSKSSSNAQASARAHAPPLLQTTSEAKPNQGQFQGQGHGQGIGDPPGGSPPVDDQPSGTHRRARNVTDDGVMGATIPAWVEGISEGTGRPCTTPQAGAAAALVDAVCVHFHDVEGQARVDAVRRAARAFGAHVHDRGGKASPFAWADWLNAGHWDPATAEDDDDELPEWRPAEAPLG